MAAQQPKRCFFREEWFTAASSYPPEARLQLYEAVFNYTYYGVIPSALDPSASGMFSIIRTMLDYDTSQYNARCVVNRQNGQKGGRPKSRQTQVDTPREQTPENPTKPKETDTNPQNPVGANIQIQKHIHKQQRANMSLCIGENGLSASERKKVFLALWRKGCEDPETETQRLVDYYDARGWVDKGGNPIKNVTALANIWKADGVFAGMKKARAEFGAFIAGWGDYEPRFLTSFVRMNKSQGGALVVTLRTLDDIKWWDEPEHHPMLGDLLAHQQMKTLEYRLAD